MFSPVAIKNGVCPHSCCSSALANTVMIRHAAAGAGYRLWLDPALVYSSCCGRGLASVFVSFFIQFSTISAIFTSGLLVVRNFLPCCVSYIWFIQHLPNCCFSLDILQRCKLITAPREFLCVIYIHPRFHVADCESVPGLLFRPSI